MRYTVIYEKGPTSWGAYVPDLPGVITVGDSREEVERLIREAMVFHIEGMREEGLEIPPPRVSPELWRFILPLEELPGKADDLADQDAFDLSVRAQSSKKCWINRPTGDSAPPAVCGLPTRPIARASI